MSSLTISSTAIVTPPGPESPSSTSTTPTTAAAPVFGSAPSTAARVPQPQHPLPSSSRWPRWPNRSNFRRHSPPTGWPKSLKLIHVQQCFLLGVALLELLSVIIIIVLNAAGQTSRTFPMSAPDVYLLNVRFPERKVTDAYSFLVANKNSGQKTSRTKQAETTRQKHIHSIGTSTAWQYRTAPILSKVSYTNQVPTLTGDKLTTGSSITYAETGTHKIPAVPCPRSHQGILSEVASAPHLLPTVLIATTPLLRAALPLPLPLPRLLRAADCLPPMRSPTRLQHSVASHPLAVSRLPFISSTLPLRYSSGR